MCRYGIRKSVFQRIVCCTVVLMLCLLFVSVNTQVKHRVRRKVVFTKSSKFFFRLNGKDTVLNSSDIFAHGWSIRVNYDLPSSIPRRHKLFKRDIHREIANIPNEAAVQGFSCIFKHLCDSLSGIQSSDTCGFLCNVGNIVKRSQGTEADFFRSFLEKCDYHTDTCLDLSKDLVIDSFG